MLLQPQMAEQGKGDPSMLSLSPSYISLLCLGVALVLILSSRVLLPVRATLHRARPFHKAFIIPISEMFWILLPLGAFSYALG